MCSRRASPSGFPHSGRGSWEDEYSGSVVLKRALRHGGESSRALRLLATVSGLASRAGCIQLVALLTGLLWIMQSGQHLAPARRDRKQDRQAGCLRLRRDPALQIAIDSRLPGVSKGADRGGPPWTSGHVDSNCRPDGRLLGLLIKNGIAISMDGKGAWRPAAVAQTSSLLHPAAHPHTLHLSMRKLYRQPGPPQCTRTIHLRRPRNRRIEILPDSRTRDNLPAFGQIAGA